MTNRVIMIVTIIGGILAALLWLQFFAYTQSSVADVRARDFTSVHTADKLQSLRNELRETKQLRARLYELSVTKEQVPKILSTIEAIGSGIELLGIAASPGSNQLNINLTYDAPMSDILEALAEIYRLTYALSVQSLTIERLDDSRVHMRMGLSVALSE